MNVNWQSQLRAFFQEWIQTRIIDMHSQSIGCRSQSASLITEFPNSASAGPAATFQFRHRRLAIPRLIKSGIIKTTPHGESLRVLAIPLQDFVEFASGVS